MNRYEAVQRLRHETELRFFLQGESPAKIINRLASKFPNHDAIASELINAGVLINLDGLSCGYCIVRKHELFWWGDTASLRLPSAGREQFNAIVDTFGVIIID